MKGTQILWATCAALVLLFIALAALDVIETGEAVPLTVVIVALAALWSAHEWLGPLPGTSFPGRAPAGSSV